MSNLDQNNQTAAAEVKKPTLAKPNHIVEFFRKFLVGLKRRPHNIAMLIYLVAFLVFTLNLTLVSNSTAYINVHPMGLCAFVSVLFSILGFVCMLNTYPRRQKTNYIMLAIFLVMMICVVVCDIIYRTTLTAGIANRLESLDQLQHAAFYSQYSYCFKVQGMLIAHIILIVVSFAIFAASPFIGKLLKKINTSVNIEYNAQMQEIEREDD